MKAEQIREWLTYSPPPNPEHDQTLGWIDENGQWLCPLCSSRLLGRGCSHAMRGAKPTYDETGLECIGCGPLSVEIGENPPVIDDQNDFEDANTGCASAVDARAMLAASRTVRADFGPRQYAIAVNPKVKAKRIYDQIQDARASGKKIIVTADGLGLGVNDIFSDSVKLSYSLKYGYYTPGLYLASGRVAGCGMGGGAATLDLCPWASKGCRENCLLVSGSRELMVATALAVMDALESGATLSDPTNLSLLRTYLYHYGYDEFMTLMRAAIQKKGEKAIKNGVDLAIRLNATSDIAWENDRSGIIQEYGDITFYDYTKNPHRAMEFVRQGKDWPKNYHLCFSYSEINLVWAIILLRMGVNITVPFDNSMGRLPWEHHEGPKNKYKDVLPQSFLGHKVIDGDLYDPRFLDNEFWPAQGFGKPPYIVGLRVKGRFQRKSGNAFFFPAAQAEQYGNSPEFIAEAIYFNTVECMSQKKKLPPDDLARDYLLGGEYSAFAQARAGE